MGARDYRGESVAYADDEIDLLDIWNTIDRYKWSILGFTAAVCVVAYVFVSLMTPVYRSTATLMVEPGEGLPARDAEFIQLEMLNTRNLAEQVVDKLVGEPNAPDGLTLERLASGLLEDPESLPAAQRRQALVNQISRKVQVTQQDDARRIDIKVEGADPALAAQLANALGNVYIDNYLKADKELARESMRELTEQLREARRELESSRQALLGFQEQENLVNIQLRDVILQDDLEGVETLTVQTLSDLTARLVEARQRTAAARRRLESAGNPAEGYQANWETLPGVLRDELARALKHDVADAGSHAAELTRRYGSEDPRVMAAQSRLDAANRAWRNRIKQVVGSFEQDYDQALAEQRQIEQDLEQARQELYKIQSKQDRLRDLGGEVEYYQQLYDSRLARFRELHEVDLQGAEARFVSRAQPADRPAEPRKMMITGLAGVLSLMLGVMAAFLRAALDNTVKVAGELERKVGLNVLGVVPLETQLPTGAGAPQLYGADGHQGFAESIRSLRTNLVLSRADPYQVMVVTSSIPGEGTTTVACNLALAMGQLEKVLLIDADMRRPQLAGEFGLKEDKAGLADLLTHKGELADCIQPLAGRGIDLLPAGPASPNALDLLSSARFAEVLDELKAQYDRVIIDSTAIQAVSDALVLSTHADALIYVVRANATDVNVVQNGIKRLLDVDAPLLGMMLNAFDPARAPRHGRDGYAR